MKKNKFAEGLLDFIEKSPSCFHLVDNISEKLLSNGFCRLEESEKWTLVPGGKYFVTRNCSSIISFVIPQKSEKENSIFKGFFISASHSDSPSFKIKENPEMKSFGYVKLNVEKYGGMLMQPWFDRPLSFAGRVILKCDEDCFSVHQKLVNIDRDLLMIPNLAIHINRDANKGHEIKVQSELMPIISCDEKFSVKRILAETAGEKEEDILGYDLFLYNREKGRFWGADSEFISSVKLDDLECVYSTFNGFLEAVENGEVTENVAVHCVFDNEEVGSESRQGAASTFMSDTLHRINENLGGTNEDYLQHVAASFLVSADNAHALHPNFSDTADPVNRPKINGGVVIKFNAAQKYTSDGVSSSVFKRICEKADVPCQIFTNNSNIAGGSTLGNISNTQVSVMAVDVGLAQWAMHSPYESAGSYDAEYLKKVMRVFYGSKINFSNNFTKN